MEIKNYTEVVQASQPPKKWLKNMIIAFISGGLIGLLAQLAKVFLMNVLMIEATLASSYVVTCVIMIASLTTGLGWYEKLAQYCGAGLFIPISGFANALTCAALEGKSEGFIYGIGSRIFSLAGSVITYGVVSAALFGMIRYILFGG